MEEQEGDELPPLAERRGARCQPCCEMRMEHLKHCLDTLIELVSTLAATLGQNVANMAPAILPGIPLPNEEDREAQHPQEGEDATTSEAQIETS